MGRGRPLKYKTVEDLNAAIEAYFESAKPVYIRDETGKILENRFGLPMIESWNRPTVTGLSLWLGFSNRHALLEYQGRKDFQHVVSRAKAKIEESLEQELRDPANRPQGAIFVLKNMRSGWRENVDLTHSGGTDPVQLKVAVDFVKPEATDGGQ